MPPPKFIKEAFIMKAVRILAIVAIAALVLAPVATVYAADKDKATTSATGKKTEKVVTVVAVDPDAKTITVKDLGGSGSGYGTGSSTTPSTPGTPGTGSATDNAEKTLKVTGSAISKLNQVRPGQQITVVFNDANAMDTISDLKFDTASTGTTPPASH
jgi:hypothetical protein